MTATLTIPRIISKEMIAHLRFPAMEVLSTRESIAERRADLERALRLGNIEHGKIRILFEDDECVMQVETTVWGLTENGVILKQGTVLPVHRILQVSV